MSSKISHRDIGNRVREIREAFHLTQSAFASSLGIKQSWLSEIESGKKAPSDMFFVAIEYRYNISSQWLISGDGDMFRSEKEEFANDVLSNPSFKVRLYSARTSKKINRDELAKQVGISPDTLYGYEYGYEIPSADLLKQIAKVLNVSIEWLSPATTTQESARGFVHIPLFSGAISAGKGNLIDNQVEAFIAFRKDWIRTRGNPKNMSLIKAKGQSMEPTIQDGDIILIDHSRQRIDSADGIWAIVVDDHILIKRIELLLSAQKVKVISDNLKFETKEMNASEVIVNGKAIWISRDLEK